MKSRVFGLPAIDWAWIFIISLWRVFISTRHGLGVDEAHYVLYGLRLDWSYFDHPPLTGWIQALFLSLLGKHEWVARLPSIICGVICSFLVFKLCEKFTNNTSQARWATLALNASFLAAALWLMFVPDTALLVLTLWLVFIIFNLLDREKTTDWLQLGVCLGLCGLTKYTAVFFVVSLVGIIFTEGAFKKVKPFGVFLATLIGLIMIIPVIYWNQKHNWISFSYQQNHVMGGKSFNYEKVLVFLLTQVAAYSPFLIIPAVYGFWASRKNWNPYVRVVLWLALPNLLFFTYTSLKDEVLPHWTLTAWALIIPVGLTLALAHQRKIQWSILTSLILTFLVMAELSFQFLKFPEYQSPYADLTGWSDLHGELKELLRQSPPDTYSIAVPNWTLGSRAHYYLDDLASVFVLDDRFDQFDLWEEHQAKTRDVLMLAWKGFSMRDEIAKKCKTREIVKTEIFKVNKAPVNAVDIFWCRGYEW